MKVAGFDFVEIENYIYVASSAFNAICEVNKNTKKVQIIYTDGNKGLAIPALWSHIGRINNKIAIAPFVGEQMSIIDRKKHETIFEMTIVRKENMGIFRQSIIYENDFYFIGYTYPAILKVNADTFECEYLTQWVTELYPQGVDVSKGDYYIADGYVQSGSCFYFPTGKDAKLLKIDCKTDEIQLIEVPCQCEKFVSIAGTDEEIWLVDLTDMYESHKVIVWNRITNYLETVELNYKGCWHAPIFYNENVYLFPMNTDGRVLKIHRNTMEVSVFEELDILFRDKYGRIANVMTVKQHDKEVTFIRRPDYTWFTYNFETGELKEEIYTIDDCEFVEKYNAEKNSYYDKIYKKAINVGDAIYEEDIPLKEFFERI